MLLPLEGWGAKLVINGKEVCEPSECMCNAPIDFLKAFCDLLSKEPDNRKVSTVYIDCEGPEFYLTFHAGSIMVTKDYYNNENDSGWKTEIFTGCNMKLLAKELISDIENNLDYFSNWNDMNDEEFKYGKNLEFWLNTLKSILED